MVTRSYEMKMELRKRNMDASRTSERNRAVHAALGLPGLEVVGSSRLYFPTTLRLHSCLPPHRLMDVGIDAPQESAPVVHVLATRVTRVHESTRRRRGAGLNPLGPLALRNV